MAVVAVSVLLFCVGLAMGAPLPFGYDAEERDALYGLKAVFENKFIDGNWTGDHCNGNDPSGWFGLRCSDGRVTEVVLENMGLKGVIKPDAFVAFGELQVLSLHNNSLSGTMMNFAANQKLSRLDLSWNGFHGPVSKSLASLEKLSSLKVDHNELTREIPAFDQTSLVTLDVSNNNLSGEIPSTRVLQSLPPGSFANNSGLCGPPTSRVCGNFGHEDEPNPGDHHQAHLADTEAPSGSTQEKSNGKGSNKMTMFAVLFLLFDVVALIAVLLLFVLYRKKARRLKAMMREEEGGANDAKTEGHNELVGSQLTTTEKRPSVSATEEKGNLVFVNQEDSSFGLNDLLKASAEGLGKGIFGNTYMAKLNNRSTVVVKRLRDLKPMTGEEFTKQLAIIANLNHPNLLPLLAYFYSKQEKLLLYRFAEKGNLFDLIHGGRGSKERIPFRWSARLSVARGIARALEYLHINTKQTNTNSPPHGNLKSTNILIDENDMVLVADYSLASLVSLPIAAQSMVSFRSPEYISTKRMSRKTDVWSFGCLLLELLTGRVSANSTPQGVNGVELCVWVHRAVREEWTAEIFDQEIVAQRNASLGMVRLLQVALKCCERSPEKRPEISEIVREVENIKVVADSEDESDVSIDRSLTDESLSVDRSQSASGVVSDRSFRSGVVSGDNSR
ncbi:hypothetical protein MLD38_032375 [Melastoma candidum]|uniref:Uncharacterized protein n=1 Tax=Melastoma candidum TaxID=119954 RepID=A0ACB9M3N4_9MYRT|nr:hypothetical protein MLD38_032375 [Melastoma candidum]